MLFANILQSSIDTMAQHFKTEQWVPFPVPLVFAFFADPANLPALMPPQMKARVDSSQIVPLPSVGARQRNESVAADTGSEILISFRPVPWLPLRVSWRARIVEFAWNHHFIDEQISGPFASFRHRHGVVAEKRDGVDGSLVTDEIEYALPGGTFGLLGAGIVRRRLETSFAFRQKKLPQLLTMMQRD